MKVGDAYFYYQNDHLGTPQKVIAGNGEVVWSAKYNSFGEATMEIETIENNLRFPGQYEDVETGPHYNRFRHYAPELGRYLKADPIRLNGGINFYTYSNNNPANIIDPLGLSYDQFDFWYDGFSGEDSLEFQKYEEEFKKQAIEAAKEVGTCVACTVTCTIVEYIFSKKQDKSVENIVNKAKKEAKRKATKLVSKYE